MFQRLKRLLRIPVKLGLLVALLLIPLGLLLYQLTVTSNTAIDFGRREILGVEYLRPLRTLYEHVGQHRGLAGLVLAGDTAREADRAAKARQIEADLTAVSEVDGRLGRDLGTSAQAEGVRRSWEAVRDQVKLRGLDAPGSYTEHTALLDQIYRLIREVGDSSNLILDPDLDSYYLMDAVVVRLPQVAEAVGQLRGVGAEVAQRGLATTLERARLAQLGEQVRGQVAEMRRGFEVAGGANPSLQGTLDPRMKEVNGGIEAFLGLSERQLLAGETVRVSAGDFYTAGTVASGRVFSLYDLTLERLRLLLDARVARLTRQRDGQLLLSGLLTLAALAGTLLIARGVNRQVRTISSTLRQVGAGNLEARAGVLSGDELGATAQGLNSMLDNIRGLMQSQEERDRIQGSIMKLLTEVSSVAEGDLRASAEVGPDITGAIADSFNYMITELRQVIERVKATSEQVSAAALGTQATAERLAQGSASQAAEIHQTSAVMDQMAAAIRQASENAASAAQVAEQALGKATQGAESVARTIEGMTAIRGQVQETSKRIKRLGESSQEIGEIVQVIGDIADRTSILALNATIQAAAAGDAGRGFMVVAEEVERLAQRAASSSKSIETLVKTIQTETTEASAAMDATTREVVGGSARALLAGKSLQEIEEVSRRLEQLIQAVSNVTSHHARGALEVVRTMERISELTQGTAASTRDTALSIRGLATMADGLRESMDRFKLPAAS